MYKKPSYEELEQRVKKLEREAEQHKQREKDLNAKEEGYRDIIETIEDSYLEVDLEGNFITFNNSFCDLLGCSKDELRGRNNREFVDTANAEKVYHIFNSVYETGKPVSGVSWEYIRRDGTKRYGEASVSLIKDNDGKRIGFRGIGRDITERRQAEKEMIEGKMRLTESNQLLAGVLEHTHILAVFLDPQFNFIWVNQAYAVAGKHEPSFFSGKNHFDLYPHEENQALFQRVVDTGEPFFAEAKPFEYSDQPERGVTYWDWSLIPIKDDSGMVTGLIFTLAEVTGRIRVEEALQESEKRFRLLTESLLDTVYEFDPKGKFTYVNEAGVRILGYSKDELLGNIQVRDTISKEDYARSREAIGEIFKGKTIVAERTLIRKDGTTFIGELHSGPIYKGKNVIGVRGILRDITKRKRTAEALQQGHKLEALGALAGGIAHQFNNALYTITGNIDLLELDLHSDATVVDYTKAMKNSTHRMAQLTMQLLAYARGGKYQTKVISFGDFVRNTLPLINHTIDSAIHVDTDLPRDILKVEADLTQMQMVLSAVLTNSSEAIDGKGCIRVICRNTMLTDEAVEDFPGLKPGNYACLIVADDGKGMDEETRTRIFEPFFTTKFEGRGLGMAATYGIVKNHDGWISVDSKLGKGTIVEIYLPEGETPVKEGVKKRPRRAEWVKGTGTILVIDDEEVVMTVTKSILERMGYSVLEARTGQEALDVIKTFDGDIDLAMLDILMPGMSGEIIYPLLKKARPNLKVLVFSGYSIDGPVQKILDAGAEDFIQKPFTMADLSEKLKKTLGSKQ